jgi:hypothetical protein
MRAHVGEADCARDGIARSAGQRTFRESAVVVTTGGDVLTKGHVRDLEARLIATVTAADRVTRDTARPPLAERRRLSESDRASMEAFLGTSRVVLPVPGLDLLKPRPRAGAASGPSAAAAVVLDRCAKDRTGWTRVGAVVPQEQITHGENLAA